MAINQRVRIPGGAEPPHGAIISWKGDRPFSASPEGPEPRISEHHGETMRPLSGPYGIEIQSQIKA